MVLWRHLRGLLWKTVAPFLTPTITLGSSSSFLQFMRVDYSAADGSHRHEVITFEPLPYRSYAAQVGTLVSAFVPRPVLYLSALYVTVLEY